MGTIGHADPDEITLEKSIDIEKRQRRRRADLSSFDLEAFYRRQGVYNSATTVQANEGDKNTMLERQMTTEEFEQDMADNTPVQLSKKVSISKKLRPPDMVDRDAFYRRLGLDLSEKKSEAPTEKKG